MTLREMATESRYIRLHSDPRPPRTQTIRRAQIGSYALFEIAHCLNM
jgi:hypothetical protein